MSAMKQTFDGAEPADADAERLKERADAIDRLLDELRASSGPLGFSRVEELVSALVELYGAGLERLLSHVRDFAVDAPGLESRLAGDELLASLLSLHGLHPYGIEVRIRQALDALETRLCDRALRLELVAMDAVRVELRLLGEGSVELKRALADVAKRVVGQAAPELTEVHIAGLPDVPAASPALIPVERLLPRGRP